MERNLHKYCRVCISRNTEMMSIFEEYKFPKCNLQVFEVIIKCASVQIQKLDGFSEQICERCVEHLSQAFSFKQLCEASDYKIRNNLIDGRNIVSQDDYCEEIIKIRCAAVKEKEITDVKSKIKSEFDEEDTKIQHHGMLHEVNEDFTRLGNLNASTTDLQEWKPKIMQLHDSQETKIHCIAVNNGIKDENVKHNISEDGEIAIKREFHVEEIKNEYGVLENQLHEEHFEFINFTKSQILNDELLGNSQQIYDSFNEREKTILNNHTRTDLTEPNNSEVRKEAALISYSSERPHKCNTCNKRFTLQSVLNRHKKIHLEEKPHKCETCGKSFIRKETLNIHMRIHTEEKTFKCEFCDNSFKEKEELNIHKKTHLEEQPYKCGTCGKCFKEKAKLNRHTSNHTAKRAYNCETCTKCFKSKAKLNDHKRIHTGEKPYKCEICNKCFTLQITLIKHSVIHTAEKPYKCEVCNKCFTQSGNLNIHRRVHTGERPYNCETCSKCFKDKTTLNLHKRIHTGEKPYNCETCGKSFTQLSNLTKHNKTHIAKKSCKL